MCHDPRSPGIRCQVKGSWCIHTHAALGWDWMGCAGISMFRWTRSHIALPAQPIPSYPSSASQRVYECIIRLSVTGRYYCHVISCAPGPAAARRTARVGVITRYRCRSDLDHRSKEDSLLPATLVVQLEQSSCVDHVCLCPDNNF